MSKLHDRLAETRDRNEGSPLVIVGAGVALVVIIGALLYVFGILDGSGGDEPANKPVAATNTTTAPQTSTSGDADPVLTGPVVADPIAGASTADGKPMAWPGQPLTAPDPEIGTATGWRWQTCNAESCTDIGGATSRTWASPPVNTPTQLRAVVQVQIGDARIWAASAPITAQAWPNGIAPGQVITTTTTTAPPPPSPEQPPAP